MTRKGKIKKLVAPNFPGIIFIHSNYFYPFFCDFFGVKNYDFFEKKKDKIQKKIFNFHEKNARNTGSNAARKNFFAPHRKNNHINFWIFLKHPKIKSH